MRAKIKIITIVVFTVLIGCKEKNNDNQEIEHSTTEKRIDGDFDKEKYPLLEKAMFLKLDGKAIQAITEFNRAEEEYGKLIQISLNRGTTYREIGQTSKAEADFTQCLKMDSTYLPALLNRAIAYREAQKIDLACSDLTKAKSLKVLDKYNSDKIDKLILELDCGD